MVSNLATSADLLAQTAGLQELPFFPAGVVFLGYVVLGITGFGSALIIIPLLAWQWPLTLVVPLVLMTDIPTSLLHTGLNFREVAWRELPRLLLPVVVGTLAGVVLLMVTSGQWLLGVLGLYVTWIGIRGIRPQPETPQPVAGAGQRTLAGFLMGMVESMFGTAGPIVMMWLTRRLHDPRELRATMPTTIVFLSSLAITGSALAGNLQQGGIWRWLAVLLPFAFLGVWCGHRLAMRIHPATLKPIIFSLLTLSGASLTLKALL